MLELIRKFIRWIINLFTKPESNTSEITSNSGDIQNVNLMRFKNNPVDKRPPPKSFQEAYERSWEFLAEIAKKVQELFSEKDTNKLFNLGKVLFNSGMRYIHEKPKFIVKKATRTPGKIQDKEIKR